MADWLNVVLAGAYSITVSRDGTPVNPAAVGATLTVSNGVITLDTPAESHEWSVAVTPALLPRSKFRMRSWDFTATLASASALTENEVQALNLTPPVSPDPVEFAQYAQGVALTVVESP